MNEIIKGLERFNLVTRYRGNKIYIDYTYNPETFDDMEELMKQVVDYIRDRGEVDCCYEVSDDNTGIVVEIF